MQTPTKTPQELAKDLADAKKVSMALDSDLNKKAVAKVTKQPTKDDLANEIIALKKDRDNAHSLLESQKADLLYLRSLVDQHKEEQEAIVQKLDKARVEDRTEHETEYLELQQECDQLRKDLAEKEQQSMKDERMDALAQDMAELKTIVIAMAPPSGLRATTNPNPFGTRSETGSVSSVGSVQSASAYEATGDSTTVSGVVVSIYERLSTGRLYTWRDNTGEYKPISQSQFAKKFKSNTLEGGTDNAFNRTNVAGVPVDTLKEARLSASGMLS